MNPVYDNKFMPSSFSSMKGPNEQKQVFKKIDDSALKEFAEKSIKKIEKITDDPIVQEILRNKAVAMTLLDKSGRIKGQYHPHTQYVEKFCSGACTSASKAIIDQLKKVGENQKINEKSKTIIIDWIENESKCLIIGSILDYWSCPKLDDWVSSDANLLEIVTTIHNESLEEVNKIFKNLEKIDLPKDEIEIVSNAIANHLKEMKKDEFFIIPSGSLEHCTRVRIDKNQDGTFELIHFNTGLGAIGNSSANKYGPIHQNKLEDPQFWKDFVNAKMTPGMDTLKQLLRSTCQSEPQPLDKELTKSFQETGSCTFHASLAEFKYYFITSFAPNLEEGYQEYKKIKYLLTKNAFENEAHTIDQDLLRNLVPKEKLGRRYLDWLTIVDYPEKYENLKEAHFEAILLIEPTSSREKLNTLIQGKSPLKCLSILNNYLDKQLKNASYEKLEKIRYTQDEKFLVNDVNYLGMRQMMWIEYNRVFLKEIVESKGIKGSIFNVVKSISESIMSKVLDKHIQKATILPSLDNNQLSIILKEYVKVENPIIVIKILEDLRNMGLIDQNLYTSMMMENIKMQNSLIAKKLLDDLRATGFIDEHLYKLTRIALATNNQILGVFLLNKSCGNVITTLNYLRNENLINQGKYSEYMVYAETEKMGIKKYVKVKNSEIAIKKLNDLFDNKLIKEEEYEAYKSFMLHLETEELGIDKYVKIKPAEIVINKIKKLLDMNLLDKNKYNEIMIRIETKFPTLEEYISANEMKYLFRDDKDALIRVVNTIQSLFEKEVIDKSTSNKHLLRLIWEWRVGLSEAVNLIKNIIINDGLLTIKAFLVENTELFIVGKNIDATIESVENAFQTIMNLTEIVFDRKSLLETKSEVYCKISETMISSSGCMWCLELAYKLERNQDKESVIDVIRNRYLNIFLSEIVNDSIADLQKYKNDLQLSSTDMGKIAGYAINDGEEDFLIDLMSIEGKNIKLEEIYIDYVTEKTLGALKYLYYDFADDEGKEKLKLSIANAWNVDGAGEAFKQEIGC